jgi:hypothetical protein|tara:strand:+ start:2352 stop:2873 length:522 start_codon:yes stop_codon:yes gene_type:complete
MTKSTKEKDMTDKKSTIWQEELRKHLDNATPTEDWRKQVEQDDRIIQFDAGEEVQKLRELADACPVRPREEVELLEGNMGEGKAEVLRFAKELIEERAKENPEEAKALIQSIGLPDLNEESKRSDRFFGMRLKGKSIDDIENTFLAMFAEFVSLMALLIGMLGFGVLLWAIFS